MNPEVQKEYNIKSLQEIEALIVTEQEVLENKIALEVQSARENGISNKEIALAACRRKKLYEKQLIDFDTALTRVEILRDFVSSGRGVDLYIGGHGAASPDNMNQSIEDINTEVNETLRDTSELLEKWRENKVGISNGSVPSDFDVDELKTQLEELLWEDPWTGSGDFGKSSEQKDVPSKSSNSETDEEFAKLQCWAE